MSHSIGSGVDVVDIEAVVVTVRLDQGVVALTDVVDEQLTHRTASLLTDQVDICDGVAFEKLHQRAVELEGSLDKDLLRSELSLDGTATVTA